MYQWIRMALPVVAGLAFSAISPAAAPPPADAVAFVNAAAQAGLTEVQAAKLALKAGASGPVKSFASRMITDHERSHAQLAAIAKSKQIPVSATLDAEHARVLDSLKGQAGGGFDAAYAAQMVEDHAKAVALFQANVSQPDGELASFAGKTLPVLQEHKRLADNLKANLAKEAKSP